MSSTLIVQLDMRTLCQEANLTADCVIEIVEHGIVEPTASLNPQGERPTTGCSTTTRRSPSSAR